MRQDSEEGPGLSGAFRHLEDDCMLPLRAVKKRKLPRGEVLLEEEQTPLAPPAEYQKAMRSVGSAQSRLAPSPERMRPPEGPALIPPEQYVGDDWLEDDVGSHKRSRWRQEEGSGSGSESAEATGPDSDNRDPCQPLPAARKRRRRVQQSRLTQLIDRIPLGRTRGVSTVEGPEPSWAGGPDDFQGTEDSMGGASPHSALTQVSQRAWFTSSRATQSQGKPSVLAQRHNPGAGGGEWNAQENWYDRSSEPFCLRGRASNWTICPLFNCVGPSVLSKQGVSCRPSVLFPLLAASCPPTTTPNPNPGARQGAG